MIKSHHHNRLLKEKVYRRKGNKKVTLPRDPPISVITFLSYVLSCFSHVQLLAIPWTIACQVPLSMGFSWQGYWSGLPFLPAGDGMKHQHCRVVWNFLLLTTCFLPLLYFISFVQQSTESCLQALPNLPYTLFPTLPPGLLPFFLTQGSNLGLLCLLHCRQILYHWAIRETPLSLLYRQEITGTEDKCVAL